MSAVITLENPVKLGDREIFELTLGDIKVKHLRAIGKADSLIDATIKLAATLSGEPEILLNEMVAADYYKVERFLEQELQKCQTTKTADR